METTHIKGKYDLSANFDGSTAFDVVVGKASVQKLLKFEGVDGAVFVCKLQENSFILTETFTVQKWRSFDYGGFNQKRCCIQQF